MVASNSLFNCTSVTLAPAEENGDVSFIPQVYFDPLIGVFKGEIKARGITVFEQSHEWELIERFYIVK